MERNKPTPVTTTARTITKSTTPSSQVNLLEALTPSTSKDSQNFVTPSGRQPSYNTLLKELSKYNLNTITPSTLTSTYGKSNEAILAALLKEQGLGPTTPDTLEEQLRPLVIFYLYSTFIWFEKTLGLYV